MTTTSALITRGRGTQPANNFLAGNGKKSALSLDDDFKVPSRIRISTLYQPALSVEVVPYPPLLANYHRRSHYGPR